VQTIHAFCERLLQRFPLEAGIAPHFAVLDETLERDLQQECINRVISQAASNRDTSAGKALKIIIAYAGEERFEALLSELIGDRDRFNKAIKSARDLNRGRSDFQTSVNAQLGIASVPDESDVVDQLGNILSDEEISLALIALSEGGKTDQEMAENLVNAMRSTNSDQRISYFQKAFLTGTKSPRQRFINKSVQKDHPTVCERLIEARDRFYNLTRNLDKLRLAKASAALLTLGEKVMKEYSDAKAQRVVLDFDDLITKTSDLLNHSYAAAWVLYKLDGGIDHILVDEAQDTSPLAWDVIDQLTDEFFSGQSAALASRTVFAVGDEKQSIYGFQGAEPRMFSTMGDNFRQKVEAAILKWHNVPLNLSFRSTPAILQAIDLVFRDEALLKGITFDAKPIFHYADRQGQAGRVEIWECEKTDSDGESDPWAPNQIMVTEKPIGKLASRIAQRIKYWLDNRIQVVALGRPIRPGDILILVRRREPFVPHMIRALKSLNIPVAGADRIRITQQLAVMDLMVLGDFLLLPEDDLALATILKSPLFDLTDEQLFEIRHSCNKGALWEVLQRAADTDSVYANCVKTLKSWLARADLVPPYEFFAGLLFEHGRRKKIIARLGPEAGDAIDEFLNMALSYDDSSPPSLQGFINWMRKSDVEIKRDMEQGRDEVRIMTVHGAKGLEAEIVFMPDTCSRRGGQQSEALLPINADKAFPDRSGQLVWAIPQARTLDDVENARQKVRRREQDEYYRLLYVAMTRARDQLYICGYENKNGRDSGCWYDLVRDGLSSHLTEEVDETENRIWCLSTQGGLKAVQPSPVQSEFLKPQKLPDWFLQPAPREPLKTIPISPSYLVPLDVNDMPDDRNDEQGVLSPLQLSDQNRFIRGNLTHALLEHLPCLPQTEWEAAARRLVNARGQNIEKTTRDQIASETLKIVSSPEFAPLFGPQSQSEVPVTARIMPDKGQDNIPVLISGQIDRLAILEHGIYIVDYKTNRPPPDQPEHVADSYVAQLAAYRFAVREIYPEKSVHCMILWTDGPRMMEIPPALLDSQERELYREAAKRS